MRMDGFMEFYCSESKDISAGVYDTSSAIAQAGFCKNERSDELGKGYLI